MREQVLQRDNEITILVSMLKKEKAKQGSQSSQPPQTSTMGQQSVSQPIETPTSTIVHSPPSKPAPLPGHTPSSGEVDRDAAFREFKNQYAKNDAIENNKTVLKKHYEDAKHLGAVVKASRDAINKLKAEVEQFRVEQAMQGLYNGSGVGGSIKD
eukprot:TRINITY_DN1006_c0_g1_i1.p1 TRINITY_DN1006_c0_g1~~TRINITY_DN1006_c0_g1_i1.p1  ORF type:complete len:182 (-),score=36.80 TRINITY_DN1006_c0_g1_i1:104-568(-)